MSLFVMFRSSIRVEFELAIIDDENMLFHCANTKEANVINVINDPDLHLLDLTFINTTKSGKVFDIFLK